MTGRRLPLYPVVAAIMLAAVAWMISCGSAAAQQTAKVVTTCGAAGYTSGSTNYVTIDTAGDACAAAAVTTSSPLVVTTTDKAGTITTGGVAQTAIASNASRKGWCIQNPSTATESLYVRVNGTASAATGMELIPGAQACSSPSVVDTAAISVFAATTAHPFKGFEVQ